MLRNYLKVAIRSIFRNKLTSFINIAGLALSMVCCLLIYLYVKDEIGYDRYNKNADNIYRVTRNFLSQDGSVSLHLGHVAPPFGPLLKNDFSQMEEVARVLQYNPLLSLEENGERKLSFNESNTYIADPHIMKIFSFEMVDGNSNISLERPFTMILSDKMAEKYYGTTSIQGKHLKADNQYDFEITGVFKSFPEQSHWHPDFLISFSTLFDENMYGRKNLETNWGNNSFATYILANDQFDAQAIEAQFPAFLDRHMGANAAKDNYPLPSTWTTLFLQPLTKIHLHSHLDSEVEANGNINTVYMMSVIGLFIMLIACFNFINLSTARATIRSKEVGLRKVVGAFKKQLVIQYLSESVVIALFAMVIALSLTPLGLQWLNDFTTKSLHLNLFNNALNLVTIIAFTVLVGILAGLYPSLIISGFKPALILKGQQGSKSKGGIRKILVIAQFSISIVLIIATFITFQQLDYLNKRDLGYSKDQIITLPYFGDDLKNRYDAFYNEMIRNGTVKNASRSSIIPTGRLLDSQGSMVQKGDTMTATDIVIKDVRIDSEFFDTYQIPIVNGRNFSTEIKSDDSLSFVINEAAVRMIGWTNEEAIGKMFQNGNVKGQVIGVVKDFHFESLHEKIIPIVFHMEPNYRRMSVRVDGADFQGGIQQLEKVWHEFLPERPFEYKFLSDRYKELYDNEQKQRQLFVIFSGLAIFIASLGLFVLATFNTLQRTKEIGIRKVMGASITSILQLLTKEIVYMILIANVIAWPIAWYLTSQWLDGFAYRIDSNVVVYLLAAVMGILIGLITVGSQTLKAAMTNPASTLRNQ